MPILGLILDLGKVLVDFDHLSTCRALAGPAGLEPDAIHRLLFRSGLDVAFDTGRLDEAGFAHAALAALDRASGGRSRVDAPALKAAWAGIFTRLDANLALLDPLARRLPLLLLSNTNATHFPAVLALAPEVGRIPEKVLSYEVGLAKPDPAIYRLALARLGLPADRIAMVDDRPENLGPAAKLGIVARLHPPAGPLAPTLAGLGLA